MKYITTGKNKYLKEGVIFDDTFEFMDNDGEEWCFYHDKSCTIYIDQNDIKAMIIEGEIKELQEPKWTDDDLKDCIKFCIDQLKDFEISFEKSLNVWLNANV